MKSVYISKEKIAQAREMDLLTYLRCYEPTELVKLSSNVYTTRTHDSLKISNGKWYWWSRSIGGRTALDYLIVVKGMRFQEAVLFLLKLTNDVPVMKAEYRAMKKSPARLILPRASKTSDNVKAYLMDRGISEEVIDYCLDQGLIYESANMGSAVFLGYDSNGEIKYASYRACNDSRNMGDCRGSNKDYSFRLGKGTGDTLHVFEGAIDLLSYATLIMNEDNDWTRFNMLSLDGVSVMRKNGQINIPKALNHYLNHHDNIKKICLHLDNDEAGRESAFYIYDALCRSFDIRLLFPPRGKDYNEYLQIKKQKGEVENGQDGNTEGSDG